MDKNLKVSINACQGQATTENQYVVARPWRANSMLLVFLCTFYFILCTISGCGTFEKEITFQGRVYLGQETTDGKLLLKGPLQGARVSVLGHNKTVSTGPEGGYKVVIEDQRQFLSIYPDLKSYTIEVTGTQDTVFFSGGNYLSAQLTVQAKPGDTVEVRDIILYAYKTPN